MKTTQAAFFKIWWIVVFFGHFGGLSAQHEGYHFSHLTEAEGLVSQFETSLLEDKKNGFLWFGSRYALQRFDGEEFVQVFPEKGEERTPAYINRTLQALLLDQKGDIWFHDATGRIMRFSPKTQIIDTFFCRSAGADSLIGYYPTFYTATLFEDSKGRIWTNSLTQGLLQFDPENRCFVPAKIKSRQKMRGIGRIVEDAAGWFWLCLEERPCRYNTETGELIYNENNPDRNPLFDNRAQTVFMDMKGNLWWGGWAPLRKYSTVTGKIETYPTLQNVSSIAEDGHGRIWIGCYYGRDLVCLAPSTGKITLFKEASWKSDGLRVGDGINQLHLDSYGNLWVLGLHFVNVFQPDKQAFFMFKNTPGAPQSAFPNGEINDVYQCADGSILLTYWLDKCPLLLLDSNFNIQKKYDNRFKGLFPDAHGWKIIEDKEHQIWITQQFGQVTVFDPVGNTVRRLQPPELQKTAVEHVMRDRRGDLWFGLWRHHGLARWDSRTQKFQHFDISKSVKQGIILSIVEGPQDRLWLATDNGLLCFDKSNGNVIHHRIFAQDSTKGAYDFISSMVLYQDSLLFLGHAEGCFQFNVNTSECRKVEPAHDAKLPIANRGMMLDARNRIWYSCSSGLTKYDPKTNEATVYNLNKYLEGGQFNSSMSYNHLRDGRFFVAFNSRFTVFDPLQLPEKTPSHAPVITRFQTLGDHPRNLLSIDSTSVLKFQHDENYFTVHFSCFEFFEKTARFSWRLKGLSDSWSEPSKLALANFTNVPPGNHTFEVKAMSDDGLESPVTRFYIYIAPPYWATWWFRLLCLTAIGGIFYAIFRYREIQRLRQEQLRLRIARDLHDEVGSTLSSISILSASVLNGVQKDLDKARFGNIGEKARAALDSISDIVWSVNPENDSMEKALARMSAYAAEMLENVGAELRFEVGAGVELLTLPMEKRKDFYLIFKEAIHNCAKYARAKQVEVAIKKEDNTLILSIKDDGLGFEIQNTEPEMPNMTAPNSTLKTQHSKLSLGGNGLRNMRSRAAAMGGRLEVSSSPEKGTSVMLWLRI